MTQEEMETAVRNALHIATRAAEVSSMLALRMHQQRLLPEGTSAALARTFDDFAAVFEGDDGFAGHFHAIAVVLRQPPRGDKG